MKYLPFSFFTWILGTKKLNVLALVATISNQFFESAISYATLQSSFTIYASEGLWFTTLNINSVTIILASDIDLTSKNWALDWTDLSIKK